MVRRPTPFVLAPSPALSQCRGKDLSKGTREGAFFVFAIRPTLLYSLDAPQDKPGMPRQVPETSSRISTKIRLSWVDPRIGIYSAPKTVVVARA